MLKKTIIKFFEDRNTKKKQFQKALENIERKTKEHKIPLTR